MSASNLAVAVPREGAESVRRLLRASGIMDPRRKISQRGGLVYLPILSKPTLNLVESGATVMEDAVCVERRSRPTPFEMITESVAIDESLKSFLPRAWEKLGDVLVLRLTPELVGHETIVAEAYARVLEAKSVVQDIEGIEGEWRLPGTKKLWGESTETTHIEDGVRFRLDLAQVMFSSGNLAERMRMARICEPGEVVVDMFAGIGYFSIPMAVHSRPMTVYSCEVNPIAFHFLEENVRINRVEQVRPLLGDCREVAPEGVADRVVMGYLRAQDYLGKAFRIVRESGMVHYHEACPCELEDSRPWDTVREEAQKAGREAELSRIHRLKSYAPGVSHMVLDVRVTS